MTLRRLFLTRLLREKLLLVALIVTGAAIWFSAASGRFSGFMKEWRGTSTELESQRVVLAEEQAIEQRAAEAVAGFDSAKTLDSTRLVAELATLAQQAGLGNTQSGEPRTETTPQFAVHSVQFSVNRAELGPLLRFYEALSNRAPYVGIEQCTITADRANPNLLNARLRVTAVEVLR